MRILLSEEKIYRAVSLREEKKFMWPHCLSFRVTILEQDTETEYIQDICVWDSRQSQEATEKTLRVEFISNNFIYLEVRCLNLSLSP